MGDLDIMPDPLSRVHPNPTYNFQPLGLLSRPHLMANVAACIAMWAITEAGLGRFLITIMHSQARPTLAMFGSLQSNAAKLAMIEAAAAAPGAMKPEHLEAFDAILPLVRRAAKIRHKFAHHLWGVCDELADALLLVDPKETLNHVVESNEFIKNPSSDDLLNFTERYPKYPIERVFVYREHDFKTYLNETAVAARLLNFLCTGLTPGLGAEKELVLLDSEPAFQTALSRLRRERTKKAIPE